MVADRTKVPCRSWQTITFDRQPTCFIRIVGTHNTANEVFHCVHFECPAQNVPHKEENSEDSLPSDQSLSAQLASSNGMRATNPSQSLTEPSAHSLAQQK
eukprot:XP_017945599.1 PREDICTED: BTB/POZ domain-containing protein 9-like [Xenopus tropicalis]